MKFKKKELLLGVLLGAGLNLLNSLRDHLPDNVDDIKTRVRDTYDTAYDRVSRASDALHGEEDSHIIGKVSAANRSRSRFANRTSQRWRNSKQHRAEKVSDFGDKVRERTGKKPQSATGTHSE
jgi:hypothetical protein